MRFMLRFFAAFAALGVATPALADYVIAPYGGDITGARLSAKLAQGDVTLTAVSGDLVVLDAVNWSAHTLTLAAPSGSVKVSAVLTASGSAGLSLETGASEADDGVAMALTAGGFTGRVDFTGTGQSYRVNGTAYTLIHTIAELEAIRPASVSITGAYALAADVDWSGVASKTSLGTLGVNGRFDGLGHQLLNLVIPGSADDTGLFSSTNGGAVIRNLGVRGGSVSGGGWVGALVGNNTGVIAQVYSTADVSGTVFVGGLVGQHGATGSLIAYAWAGGNVTGTGGVGGLVGYTSAGGAIGNVWASGNVTGIGSGIGGLVGITNTNAIASETLRNAYATGNVAGGSQVGGLVGQTISPVDHVFATGKVSASSNSDVGGLVGLNSTAAGGSVSDGWFASDTPGAHPDNGVGTAMVLANLISALPGGFDATVWANQNGKTTPYLKSLPGSVYVKAESASAASALVYTPVMTLDQLQAINANLAGNFALFNDIDATATSGWNGGAGFVPIGNCAAGLDGRFDGLGHVIVNPTISLGGSGLCVGLFGAIGTGGVVRNVGVDGGTVAGGVSVGGLVGYNDAGTISHAYATASVTASVANGGGLVGFTTGDVSDAYATGSVTVGGDGAGGLTAGSQGTITRIWASGKVTGSGSNVGGLVGLAMNGTVDDSYWDSYSTGQGGAVGVVNANATVTNVSAITSDPAQSGAANYAFKQSAYANLGAWTCLYVCMTSDNAWVVFNGYTRPFLQMEYATTIDTTHQLQLMNLALGASYVLGGPHTSLGNLDASETGRNDGTAANSNGMWAKTGFVTIGSDGNNFSGSLDGQFHLIANLTINQPEGSRIGLFGKAQGLILQNLALRNISITGGTWVGALVGYSLAGSISGVYVSGSVSGRNNVGGLVGQNGGSISNAYMTGSVTASDSYVGGLVSTNEGAISNTYAIASISGINAGALVSSNADQHGGSIAHSFWNTDVSFQGIVTSDSLAGLTGGSAADAKGLSSVQWLSQGPIATGAWDTAATWLAGYPYPVLKGFPYVLVTASGVTATYGSSTPTVASYISLDRYGTSVALGGTLAWFDDPQRAAGTAVNIGGNGASVPFPYQLTYIAVPLPTVNPASQMLTFGAQASQTYSAGGTFAIDPLAATDGDSPIVYSSTTPAVCTVSGTTVAIVSRGACTIAANTGTSPSGNYAMAAEVTQNVAIGLAAQTIMFGDPGAQTLTNGTFSVTASTSSGLAVTFAVGTPEVCSVGAASFAAPDTTTAPVTMLAAGTCSITASQAGNNDYGAATPVTQNVTIERKSTTLTLSGPGSVAQGQALTLVATVQGDPPSGSVLFCDGAFNGGTCTGTALCAPGVALAAGASSSTAMCTTSLATPGTHSITAYYGGDAAFLPVAATQPLVVSVDAAAATTAVPAPTLGLWSLLMLFALVARIGGVALWRRRAH